VPKLKTSRGAAKRFKVTGSGRKIKRQRAYANHILTKKSPKRKRNLRNPDFVHTTNMQSIKRLIPYG
jgi:large subunit ribosomal protein L35